MVILETTASRPIGTAGKRGGRGSGLAKNLSLVFVCALRFGRDAVTAGSAVHAYSIMADNGGLRS